jgi:hypothetical protein
VNILIKKRFSVRSRNQGLAAVEMAIVLPVMLFLMLACAEIGRAMYQYNALTKAVRNGAIYLGQVALNPGTQIMDLTPAKIAAMKNIIVFGSPVEGGTAVIPGFSTANVPSPPAPPLGATNVTVSASLSYSPLFTGGIPNFRGGSISSLLLMTASCNVRAL